MPVGEVVIGEVGELEGVLLTTPVALLEEVAVELGGVVAGTVADIAASMPLDD
jgi:hypothetical protein